MEGLTTPTSSNAIKPLLSYPFSGENMDIHGKNTGGSFDLLPEIKGTIRDCIKAGLITTTNLYEFDQNTKELDGPELEDYLQKLWDEI